MRFILLIFLVTLIGFSCAKPKTKNIVPAIEYKDLQHAQKSEFTGQDTAVLVLSYEDGDGDLFVDLVTQGPNLIFTPYFFNSAKGRFDIEKDPITADTFRITSTIKQPDDGYYKGKSIKGEIYIPLREYRLNDQAKIIKFTGFMIDLKGHRSNTVSSPVYTLNF
jgi:hypothetical protein